MSVDAVERSVAVNLSVEDAFTTFTQHYGQWYQDGPHSWRNPDRAIRQHLECHLNGRLIELYDEATGEGYVFAYVIEWEPPRRFLLRWVHHDENFSTEVEVTFTPADSGTNVTICHRGWSKLPHHIAQKGVEGVQKGWPELLVWYSTHCKNPKET